MLAATPKPIILGGRAQGQILVECISQGGGNEGNAVFAILGGNQKDAATGQIQVTQAQVKHLVDAHAGVGQRQEPGSFGSHRHRILSRLGKHGFHQTRIVRFAEMFGQRLGQRRRRHAKERGMEWNLSLLHKAEKGTQVTEFRIERWGGEAIFSAGVQPGFDVAAAQGCPAFDFAMCEQPSPGPDQLTSQARRMSGRKVGFPAAPTMLGIGDQLAAQPAWKGGKAV